VLAHTISCAIDLYGCQIIASRQLSVHLTIFARPSWRGLGTRLCHT